MPRGTSRRRAVARGLTLVGAALLSTRWWSSLAAAQSVDPSNDSTSAEPPSGPDAASTPTPAVVQAPSLDGTPDAVPTAVVQVPEEPTPVFLPTPPVANMGVPPVKLMIPVLGISAAVESVGQDPDGAMSAPTDPDEIAWYNLGPGMGVPGNAVFAGHINWAGVVRPFGLIDRLDPGDVIQVLDANGTGYEYAVESLHWVRAEGAPVEEIFAQPPSPVITLITCGGEFVPSRREYLDRLILRARGA